MMNKKADVPQKAIYYLLFGVMFTVIFFVLIYLISSYISVSQELPSGIREKIFIKRFVSSPDCFVLQDKDTGRAYPGIIDWNKFSKQSLSYCYESFSDPSQKKSSLEIFSGSSTSVQSRATIVSDVFAFKLTLKILESGFEKSVETDDWVNDSKEAFKESVLVLYDGEIKRGSLDIEVST
jgi:hypothetical protein